MKKVICLFLSVIMLIGMIPLGAVAAERPFPDVPADAWYTEYIVQANEMGLIQGDENGNMMPTKSLTRAEAVAIIRNHSKRVYDYPDVTSIPFTDVPKTAWYYDAVKWAYCEGFVNGVGNNKFKPNDHVTRQDFAVMIYRYYNLGYNFNGYIYSEIKYYDTIDFKDSNAISEYAKNAVKLFTSHFYIYYLESPGPAPDTLPIMNGYKGCFNPKSTCARAEAAKILTNILESKTISYIYNKLIGKYYDVPYSVPKIYSIDCDNPGFFNNWNIVSWPQTVEKPYLFGAYEYVTRADLACLILIKEAWRDIPQYNDYSFSDYQNNYAEFAYREGYMLARKDGTFAPNDYVTIEEAIYFLNRLNKRNDYNITIDNSNNYSDWNDISPEYVEAVRLAVSEISNGQKGYFVSIEEGKITPQKHITRLELFKMM